MNLAQYRCLVAHMMYWGLGLEEAMRDSGVSLPKDDVLHELFKAGYEYDEETDRLTYEE